jgi:two-component system, cell cycle sensor histidine kinase and response regulator CckA
MVIQGYAEIVLGEESASPAVRKSVATILRTTASAASLTRQLLSFSRRHVFSQEVLDLNSLVSRMSEMLLGLLRDEMEFVVKLDPNAGCVCADPGQIEQVIMNLAVNARDAMPHGGKLTIETANVTLDANYSRFHAPVKPGDYVMLAISDTGVGMDADTQAHIFEPFYTTKGLKGTGLGLSTVYGIVKQSDGYIWLYSEAGKGTSFKIYLPRFSATGEVLATQPALAADADQTSPGHETILLVEDEENLRRLARQSLENQGYRVIDAPDGATAIQISQAHQGPIHLLLTDVIMPGMNGRELANKVSPTRPEMRVLYMSGYTENHIGHNGTLDEGITLLQKPFTLPALKAKVREMLDTPLPQEIQMSARLAQSAPIARTRNKVSSPFRATRFDLHLPLKYRLVGESGWREGKTENISRSGMLFQAEEPIAPNAQLEINLVLPAEIAGLAAAEVVCRGEVVRTVNQESGTVSPTLAAKILQYHFQHGSLLSEA